MPSGPTASDGEIGDLAGKRRMTFTFRKAE
jgi:hypothetical protein